MKKTLISAAIATMAMAGALSATPAMAQDYGYPGDGYGYDAPPPSYRGYDRDYRQGDYRDYRRDSRHYRQHYRDNRRCGSGATGTILGAVAGALLGGEIGRGGSRYSRRSGTGTIVGAGVGALVGREIDRGDCNDHYRRGYRR